MAIHFIPTPTTIDPWASSSNLVTGIGTGDFTVAFWFLRTPTIGASEVNTYACANNDRRPGFMVARLGSNVLSFSWAGSSLFNNFDTVIPVDGAWRHAAFRRSSGTVSGWLNGVQEATTYSIGTSWPDSLWVIGGRSSTVNSAPMEGHLAEVALWNRALTGDQIASLAAGYAPSYEPRGLISYMPLHRLTPQRDAWSGLLFTDPVSTGTPGDTVNSNDHPRQAYPMDHFVAARKMRVPPLVVPGGRSSVAVAGSLGSQVVVAGSLRSEAMTTG